MGCAQNNTTASLVIDCNHFCDKSDDNHDEINDGDDDNHYY